MSTAYVITSSDRDDFVRCPRAWDLHAKTRQGLQPVVRPTPFDFAQAVRDALAVYYFPGMWTWDRGVVGPLVLKQFERSLEGQRASYEKVAALSGEQAQAQASHLTAGRDLLARYMGWAPEYDLFWPLRVETDYDLHIPDADHPGRELGTPDGRPVHFQGRLEMLMADQADARWVVCHRVTQDCFSDPDLLALDETGLGDCWGWENDNLVAVSGVLYNEMRVSGGPAFRRTTVARSREELAGFGARLCAIAREMVGPGLTVPPRATPEHCARCGFRAPCLAMNQGGDPGPILAGSYQARPADEWVEGRLGSASWSQSRGAAPMLFKGDAGRRRGR